MAQRQSILNTSRRLKVNLARITITQSRNVLIEMAQEVITNLVTANPNIFTQGTPPRTTT